MPRHQYPLTALLLDLDEARRTDPQRLAQADPERIAKHYGVKLEHAAEYLRRAREQ